MKRVFLLSLIAIFWSVDFVCAKTYERRCDPNHLEDCAVLDVSDDLVGGSCTEEQAKNRTPGCTGPSHATKTRCSMQSKVANGPKEPTCGALECSGDDENGYLLWHIRDKNGNPQNQGICYSREQAINACKKKGICTDGCDCVPRIIDLNNDLSHKKNGGFMECECKARVEACNKWGTSAEAIKCCEWEKAGKPVEWVGGVCRCKDQNKTLDTETGECKDMYRCKVVAKGEFGPCPDGSYVHVDENTGRDFWLEDHPTIRAVATEKGYCKDKGMTNEEMKALLTDARVKKYVTEQLCTKDNSGVPSPSSTEVQQAKQKLESFFGSVSSGKRDVWKDKDGNFNTKRLASDLTAGVVLGTVGGVVSGVVIKKKQIEKGFEALHCTVGGQTVADWGDTFTVGLNR